MNDYYILLLPVIAFAAFFLKGLTGFGPALLVIPLGSLLFPPYAILVASSFLDLIAGSLLYRTARTETKRGLLFGLVISMVLGTFLGTYALSSVPVENYKVLLGIAVILLGGWFAFLRPNTASDHLRDTLPEDCDRHDLGCSFLAGMSGGLFGVSGPPIIWHFGRRYRKTAFRDLLIVFFAFAAMARVFSFSVAGIVGREAVPYTLASLPGLVIGLYLGNKAFLKIDETRFSQAVGLLLMVIAVPLVVPGISIGRN